ncbi:hypothetical protein FKM82_017527 [Ascaphus truei]
MQRCSHAYCTWCGKGLCDLFCFSHKHAPLKNTVALNLPQMSHNLLSLNPYSELYNMKCMLHYLFTLQYVHSRLCLEGDSTA